ncbi:MAG: D-alanine--D-alanine ligase, partial [Thermodesulfobacterium geofontis]
FLDSIGLPYQGAGVLGSAIAMHKGISKNLYKLAGLKVPEGKVFSKENSFEEIREYAKKLGFPLIIKPATQGSSVGLSIVKKREDLKEALEKAFNIDNEVIVEKYLKGREITVGILDEKPLPVVEIIPKVSETFDYETKYTPGLAEEVCPAPLSEALTQKAQEYGLIAHRALKLRHYSRTDMIIVGDEIYVLETNTIPGMTETSLLPLAAKVAGYSFEELIQKLLELALREKIKNKIPA